MQSKLKPNTYSDTCVHPVLFPLRYASCPLPPTSGILPLRCYQCTLHTASRILHQVSFLRHQASCLLPPVIGRRRTSFTAQPVGAYQLTHAFQRAAKATIMRMYGSCAVPIEYCLCHAASSLRRSHHGMALFQQHSANCHQ